MTALLFCTSNTEKFATAQLACKHHDITIEQKKIDIEEIQSEDGETILKDKLQKAYQHVKQPLIVTDDTWLIPGLNGFPGPYMKSINHWFTPDDLLRLILPLEDRSIYLIQHLGFTDGTLTKTFSSKVPGTLLREIKGTYGSASHKLISMDGDNGLSIAEIYDKNLNHHNRQAAGVLHEFIAWYKSTKMRI